MKTAKQCEKYCVLNREQNKLSIWNEIVCVFAGCTPQEISMSVSLPLEAIGCCLQELQMEDKVYEEKGKWYPVTAITLADTTYPLQSLV